MQEARSKMPGPWMPGCPSPPLCDIQDGDSLIGMTKKSPRWRPSSKGTQDVALPKCPDVAPLSDGKQDGGSCPHPSGTRMHLPSRRPEHDGLLLLTRMLVVFQDGGLSAWMWPFFKMATTSYPEVAAQDGGRSGRLPLLRDRTFKRLTIIPVRSGARTPVATGGAGDLPAAWEGCECLPPGSRHFGPFSSTPDERWRRLYDPDVMSLTHAQNALPFSPPYSNTHAHSVRSAQLSHYAGVYWAQKLARARHNPTLFLCACALFFSVSSLPVLTVVLVPGCWQNFTLPHPHWSVQHEIKPTLPRNSPQNTPQAAGPAPLLVPAFGLV
ncbi:uncharacterized protein LOC120388949 [Mauremys reevesii]|uniref:uncharacterized protein LOC120388949 n=1 Tax=Mauremys reevesii TaxID=260615 RepID=UPI00193F7852|nr:uncharacterized protein LOC120388949 [Mauremys reevesii]